VTNANETHIQPRNSEFKHMALTISTFLDVAKTFVLLPIPYGMNYMQKRLKYAY
jgi:hypothetical protein